MKKALLIFIFLSFHTGGFAQRIKMGFEFSPMYNFSFFYQKQYENELEKMKPLLTYTVGIPFQIQLGNKVDLEITPNLKRFGFRDVTYSRNIVVGKKTRSGWGYTVYPNLSTDVIFSCAWITKKKIRFKYGIGATLLWLEGDAFGTNYKYTEIATGLRIHPQIEVGLEGYRGTVSWASTLTISHGFQPIFKGFRIYEIENQIYTNIMNNYGTCIGIRNRIYFPHFRSRHDKLREYKNEKKKDW
jgi:hypothetical protein